MYNYKLIEWQFISSQFQHSIQCDKSLLSKTKECLLTTPMVSIKCYDIPLVQVYSYRREIHVLQYCATD